MINKIVLLNKIFLNIIFRDDTYECIHHYFNFLKIKNFSE